MTTIRRNVTGVILLSLVASGLSGCGDSLTANATAPRLAPSPLGWELTPLQQRLLMSPVSPEAAGRPATRADLEEVRGWFGPGQLEAVLAVVNRTARARGADTLPHCVPLCAPRSPAAERNAP
jgi:hypothetical protein